MSVIDTSTCNAEVQSRCEQTPSKVTVGTQPFGIALDPVTDTVYVTDLGSNDEGDTVSVIDAAACNGEVPWGCGQTPLEVTVGSGPLGIAVNSTTATIYVADTGQLFTTADGHTVSVINGTTCDAVQSSGCKQIPNSNIPLTPGYVFPNGYGVDVNVTGMKPTFYITGYLVPSADAPRHPRVRPGTRCLVTTHTGASAPQNHHRTRRRNTSR